MFIRTPIKLIGLLLFFSIDSAWAKIPSDWPKDGVLIMPDMKSAPLLSAIKNAQKSIDLTQYHLDSEDVIQALIEAKKRGVEVRIILNKPDLFPPPFSTSINKATSKTLAETGIEVHYLKDFEYSTVHYKLMIIDKEFALITTFNFDPKNLERSRNFAVTIEDPQVVETLSTLFENDYRGQGEKNDKKAKELFEVQGLILGPQHQRESLINFLSSTKKSVYIYQQDLSDTEVGEVLQKLASEGKKVRVMMNPNPFPGNDLNGLNRTFITVSGGEFRFKSKEEMILHAKLVIIDPEDGGKMYVGSCNFWPESIERSRELGIITTNTAQIQKVFSVFNKDWEGGKTYEEASQ